MGLEYLDERTASLGSHAIWENVRVDNAVEASMMETSRSLIRQ